MPHPFDPPDDDDRPPHPRDPSPPRPRAETARSIEDLDTYDDSGQPYCRTCGDIGHSSQTCPDR
jgi:hypothetical protein